MKIRFGPGMYIFIGTHPEAAQAILRSGTYVYIHGVVCFRHTNYKSGHMSGYNGFRENYSTKIFNAHKRAPIREPQNLFCRRREYLTAQTLFTKF